MERRAARQIGALEQNDVRAAEPGEPVQDRAPADAAADDDDLGAVSHGRRAAWNSGSAAVWDRRSKCSTA